MLLLEIENQQRKEGMLNTYGDILRRIALYYSGHDTSVLTQTRNTVPLTVRTVQHRSIINHINMAYI